MSCSTEPLSRPTPSGCREAIAWIEPMRKLPEPAISRTDGPQGADLEVGAISIVQTLGRSLNGLIFQPPKTSNGRRTIDLDQTTIAILRAHQEQQLLHRSWLEGAYQDNDLVFTNPLGGPVNPMALTRAFQILLEKAGIPRVKSYDLRHLHASVILQQNQSPALVSRRLGHASVSTTMDIYSHVLPGWQKESANAFAKAMKEG